MLAISQKDMLLPWRTILDNIILGMEVRGVPYNEAVGRARLMEKYGLKGFDKHYPKELSGGMKQRAARTRSTTGTSFCWTSPSAHWMPRLG